MLSKPVAVCILYFFLLVTTSYSQQCIPLYKAEYGGNGNDLTTAILHTADKGAVVIGKSTSQTPGDYDAFIMKLTESGAISWSKKYRFNDQEEFSKIREGADGSFYVLGNWTDETLGEIHPFLMKTGADGSPVWTKDFFVQGKSTEITEIQLLSDNSLLLISNQSESPETSDGIIHKLDGDGNFIWTRIYDGGKKDRLECVLEKSDKLVIGGQSQLENELYKGIYLHLDKSSGEIQKRTEIRKTPGFFSRYNERVVSLHPLANDGMYFGMIYEPSRKDYGNTAGTFLFQGRLNSQGQLYQALFEQLPDSGWETTGLPIKLSSDSSVTYIRVTPGWQTKSQLRKNGRNGISAMLKPLSANAESSAFYGLDTVPGNGYILSGHIPVKEFDPASGHNIRVVKFNQVLSGPCSENFSYGNYDSTSVIIREINAVPLTLAPAQVTSSINWTITPNLFSQLSTCNSTYCYGQMPIPEQCNENFHLTMKGAAGSDLSDVSRSSDGSLYAVGTYNNHNYREPMLVKLKPNGSPAFTKIISQYPKTGSFIHVLNLSDGTVLAGGVQTKVLNHQVSQSAIFVKFNSSGEVIWSVELGDYPYMQPEQLIELDNKDVLIVSSREFNFNLYRINSAGNVVWKKDMNLMLRSPKVQVYKNSLYIGGYINQYISPMLSLEKVDLGSGAVIWQKHFWPSDGSIVLSGLTIKEERIFVNYINPASGPGLVCMDMNGSQLSNLRFPEITGQPFNYTDERLPGIFTETADGNFALVFQSGYFPNTQLQAVKFKPDGTMLWSKRFTGLAPYQVSSVKKDGNNILIAGLLQEGGNYRPLDIDRSFLISLNADGEIVKNAAGSCVASDFTVTAEPAPPLQEINQNPANRRVKDDLDVTISIPDIVVQHGDVVTTIVCSEAGTCDKLEFSGETKICVPENNYTYTLLRNPECTARPFYLFDSSAVQLIDTTASSAVFRFKKAGLHSIEARIETGCKILSSVLEIQVADPVSSFSFGADSTICSGQPLVLHAPKHMSSYLWQDNSGLDSLIADRSGTYTVQMTDVCNRISSASIRLDFPQLPDLKLGNDSSICEGSSVLLSANNGFETYRWNTMETMQTIEVSRPGKYIVEAVHASGCSKTDTLQILQVYALPKPALGNPVLCDTGSIHIGIPNSNASYLWNTGATSSGIEISETGIYWLRVTDQNGCVGADTVYLTERIPRVANFLPAYLEICKDGGTVEINSGVNFSAYAWNTGAVSRSVVVSQPGVYHMTGVDLYGCKSSDTVEVKVKDCLLGVYFPTAFSPNGDHKNDLFKAQVFGNVVSFRLTVYNRYGEKVFETEHPGQGWDGTIRGKNADSNSFIWTCSFQLEGGEAETKKGILTLVR